MTLQHIPYQVELAAVGRLDGCAAPQDPGHLSCGARAVDSHDLSRDWIEQRVRLAQTKRVDRNAAAWVKAGRQCGGSRIGALDGIRTEVSPLAICSRVAGQ